MASPSLVSVRPTHMVASGWCCSPVCLHTQPRKSVIAACAPRQQPPSCQQEPRPAVQPHRQQGSRCLPRLPQLGAGVAAAVAGVFAPLLPSWALDSLAFDSLAADSNMDAAALGDSPPLLDTLLVVVVTYFTVMLLYLWLSSFMAGEEGSEGDSSKQPPADQSELPPGYGSFLNAHVRTYVSPGSKQVSALQDLGQAEPLEGEDLGHLKNRLAAGAAEALELQLRDCERLVRSKLLARKLGYHPQQHKSSNGLGSSSSNGSSSGAGGVGESEHAIEEMMLAAVLTSPEGLGSWQHRAAVEALIDQQLDELLPPGGGAFQEELIVRGVMRRITEALVLEESLLLLEGTDKASRKLVGGEAGAGRGKGRRDSPWALW